MIVFLFAADFSSKIEIFEQGGLESLIRLLSSLDCDVQVIINNVLSTHVNHSHNIMFCLSHRIMFCLYSALFVKKYCPVTGHLLFYGMITLEFHKNALSYINTA
jgi:hypothetical protein